MRISITINDGTIRDDVTTAVSDLIDSDDIVIPENELSEFINDLTETIIDKYCYDPYYVPHYYDETLDRARLYGYAQ